MNTRNQGIDDLLAQAATGDAHARLRLVEQIYPVLKGIAKQKLVGQAAQTMRTTDLAHEAYLRLFSKDVNWESHGQFFAIAAAAIRGVLVDHFRARSADKRGSGEAKISLDQIIDEPAKEAAEINWLDLNSALDTYALEDPDGARVLELTYFAGLNAEQVASIEKTSVATVGRQLRFGRAWLKIQLGH